MLRCGRCDDGKRGRVKVTKRTMVAGARKFARLVTLMAIGNRPRGKPDLTQRFGLQHFQATPGAHGGQNIWQKMATRLKRGGGSSSQSSEELRQQCSSEHLRARTPQQSRRDEIGGAKDAQRGARRGRRGENAVARRCDGAAAPPPRRRCHFGGAQTGRQILLEFAKFSSSRLRFSAPTP